tara:strand:+ start:1274 stop:1495 length:222 start_codon:yes stop_codon:yes gene_type:complete
MGLLDDMVKEQIKLETRPNGWVTAKEFAASTGVSWTTARRKMEQLVKDGELADGKCRNRRTGKISTVYGEPES